LLLHSLAAVLPVGQRRASPETENSAINREILPHLSTANLARDLDLLRLSDR
jgi:hypothetical protein